MKGLEAEYPELVSHILDSEKASFLESDQNLPLFRWKWNRDQLKLHFVCKHRLNVAKFFFEMIHRWLIPGRRIDVSALFSTDFHFSSKPSIYFTVAEMVLRMDPTLPREQIERNLKVIETEIRLGMVSVYHANRLLETHFTSPQQKHGQIQEKITKLLERKPEALDYDIFGQLQQFMVMSRDEFKARRSAEHLSRIAAACYVFTKSIERARENDPYRGHIRLKLRPVVLDLPWGPKEVLGVCVGLNFLNEEELFEERHLFRALLGGVAGIKAVADSFYCHEGHAKGISILYLEIEKESGDLFMPFEIKRLRSFLAQEVRKFVEVPLKSIFMPCNEEEILRHIVTLSGQLHFVKDLPQAILIFDQQKGRELFFTVILVRILFPTSYSIQYLFGLSESSLSFIPDRVKRVGLLRKRYPKEATVFRVHLSSLPFLRDDQSSVDLFRARQAVFQELEKVIGPLRDYTGGMIAKQVELIDQVQRLLAASEHRLLETFFHTLYPIEARSFLPPQQLKKWLLLWKQLLDFPVSAVKVEHDASAVYTMGLASVIPELDLADFDESQLIIARPSHDEGVKYLGYLFVSSDPEEQALFLSKIKRI